MKTRSLILGAMLITGLFMFNACQKDDNETSQTVSEQIAEEDDGVDEVLNVVDVQVDAISSLDAEESFPQATSLKSASEEVTYPIITAEFPVQGERWPVIITIDYGTENHLIYYRVGPRDSMSISMRGKIIIEKTGPHFATGASKTINFDEYYINDNHIEGNLAYLNGGMSIDNNPLFSWTVDLTLTTPDDFWIKRSVNKTREMVEGYDTPLYIWDDAFLVNGNASGENSKGWSYVHSINNLLRKRACRFPVSGTIDVVNTQATFTLDYGNGSCDAKATITDSEGNIYEIDLGRKWIRR